MSFLSKLFGKSESEKNLETDLELANNRIEILNNKIFALEHALEDAGNEVLELRNTITSQAKTIKDLQSKSNVKLTDAQAKKQLKALEKSKLKQLEDQVNAAPEQLQGSTMVYTKRTKKAELVHFSSKTEALALIEKAKRGTIKFV